MKKRILTSLMLACMSLELLAQTSVSDSTVVKAEDVASNPTPAEGGGHKMLYFAIAVVVVGVLVMIRENKKNKSTDHE